VSRIDGDAAVAGFVRVVEIGVPAAGLFYRIDELLDFRLRLLEAQNIRPLPAEPWKQSVAVRGRDTIAVARDDSHR